MKTIWTIKNDIKLCSKSLRCGKARDLWMMLESLLMGLVMSRVGLVIRMVWAILAQAPHLPMGPQPLETKRCRRGFRCWEAPAPWKVDTCLWGPAVARPLSQLPSLRLMACGYIKDLTLLAAGVHSCFLGVEDPPAPQPWEANTALFFSAYISSSSSLALSEDACDSSGVVCMPLRLPRGLHVPEVKMEWNLRYCVLGWFGGGCWFDTRAANLLPPMPVRI